MNIINERATTNSAVIDHPAPDTYNKFTPEQIKALCEIDIPMNRMFRKMPDWESMSEPDRLFHRRKAYWALRGSHDPGIAASLQQLEECYFDPAWHAECVANGWVKKDYQRATCLRDLEKKFLPRPTPGIHLIIARCPQMAMIHALRGDVSEPYWWAALSITEHAQPNFSREISDGYPGFSDEELGQRVMRIRQEKTKPALCARLAELNPAVCNVCRFQEIVRTPIALGFEHEPKRKTGRTI